MTFFVEKKNVTFSDTYFRQSLETKKPFKWSEIGKTKWKTGLVLYCTVSIIMSFVDGVLRIFIESKYHHLSSRG